MLLPSKTTRPTSSTYARSAKLSAVDKLKALREHGVGFDEKISPLLNAEQQQKFQEMREQLRRRLVEAAAGKAVEKAKAAVATWFADVHK